ncbi:hypothetical protein QWY82_16690 [Simiduia curdlanivorans]|uniref:Uncharacterized protein n=1 Tax=Simiduia curdlanivorans TaxID=1492769 RepID=A0ABV8V1B2_9GAMM|nr:hypothetical protein [Simiduia curdlanivorans]MDN3640435.1 hypothetical protein [Simiduia curdlanivorans]
MMRFSVLLLSLCGLNIAPVAMADKSVETEPKTLAPQVLAKVLEREFLYNIGLSNPGTLGVDRVRYELEVVDTWNGDRTLVKGQHIRVTTPGGCDHLLKADQRYLLPLQSAPAALGVSTATADLSSDTLPMLEQWQSDCTVATEAAAKKVIARLNQQRQGQHPALHLSAN